MNIGKCWETIREMLESDLASMFLCELRTRTFAWLFLGRAPRVSFEASELREAIASRRPHELRTARRLSCNGVRARFARDVQGAMDSVTGETKQVGLADLANGYELKTLITAATFSSIDGYLRRAAKKRNVTAVVFDNTDNQNMSDEALGFYIVEAKRRFKGRVYVLRQDGGYIRRI